MSHHCVSVFTAMLKKPVVTEVRTPTNTWSGLGFSKSMPAETIKELRRANHVSYKPSMSTTYEVRHTRPQCSLFSSSLINNFLAQEQTEDCICLTIYCICTVYSVVTQNSLLNIWTVFLRILSQDSPLSLSRSGSREGLGNGSDSENWRDRNGNSLPIHGEFPSAVGSPKRKQNKSGQLSKFY